MGEESHLPHSYAWISSLFDQMNWKASPTDWRTNLYARVGQIIGQPPPWTKHKSWSICRRYNRPRHAEVRPTTLDQAGRPFNRQTSSMQLPLTRWDYQGHQQQRQWQVGTIPWLAGLGEAIRLNFAMSQAQLRVRATSTAISAYKTHNHFSTDLKTL